MAIQEADVPAGMIRCSYSAPVEAYIASLADVNPATAESVSGLWDRVTERGAQEGHVTYFGDSEETCRIAITPRDQRMPGMGQGHDADHPRLAFSFAFRYRSADLAEQAWSADVFRQSRIRDQAALDVTEGETTGLGPNSISSVTQGAVNLTRQAIWQRGHYTISFGSTALDLAQSQVITTAIDGRARA